MFVVKPIVEAGNAAIAACNASNDAEQKTLDLRAAAVAAIQAFNQQLAAFLSLRSQAIDAITANGAMARDLVAAHAADALPAAIPDPDQPVQSEPPTVIAEKS